MYINDHIVYSPRSGAGHPTSPATGEYFLQHFWNPDLDSSDLLEAYLQRIPNVPEDGRMGSARTPTTAKKAYF